MKSQRCFLIFFCALLISIRFCYAHQQGTIGVFSNNKELNGLIQEVYVYELPKRYEATKVSICFGLKSKSTGRYYNYIRIGNENRGASAFVEVLSELYESYKDAIEAVSTYKGIIESPVGIIKCDFSQVPKGFGKSFVCNFYDITDLDNSPNIKQYMKRNKMLVETSKIKTKAVETAINGKDTYQCVDQFADFSDVVIYRNGEKVDPVNYTLFKQGKVKFKDGKKIKKGRVYFEYKRNVKHYKPFSNDLSKNVADFQDVHSGCDVKMYKFVSDPSGEDRKVLMISCDKLLKDAQNAREQFSYSKHPLTYFRDRIKLYVPIDMKEAMLTFPKAITWFSIQGSWCQFGSATGKKEDMYSGSANSFGIIKPQANSKELYFHLLCRRRHCDVKTGLEVYDNLNDETSSFPVKAGEWITIEREWRVGNPGICKHTIVDSDGKHEFYVDAYNSVCDPENESERYDGKYVGENPYNFCHPFICKIYTSKELAQYCIDRIGKCYLYYKDYELLEAENVNAFKFNK